MAYPRFQRARSFKFVTRTAGDLTLNSTSYADVSTSLDMVLNVQVGDVLEYGINALASSAAVGLGFDVATIVSGSVVNYFGSAAVAGPGDGLVGWWCNASVQEHVSGSAMYVVQAGDIASGVVTLRLRYKTSAATNRTLYANNSDRLHVWAKNLGPVDPN